VHRYNQTLDMISASFAEPDIFAIDGDAEVSCFNYSSLQNNFVQEHNTIVWSVATTLVW